MQNSTLAILLLVSHPLSLCASNQPAHAGSRNVDAKIAIHLTTVSGKGGGGCTINPSPPPCNDSENNLTIQGDLNTQYDAFILALDGDMDVGISGAEFGISYDYQDSSGVDIVNWIHCADQEFSQQNWWKTPNGGTLLTFSSSTNCQDTPASGDLNGGVTTVLGFFRLSAYSPDILSITEHITTNGDSLLQLSQCATPAVTPVEYPWGAGRAAFGGALGGLDPCRGPFSSFAEFDTLTSSELNTCQIRVTDLRPFSVPTILFQAPNAVSAPNPFFQFKRVGIRYPNAVFQNTVELTDQEIADVIDSLGTLSSFISGEVDSAGALSVTLLHSYGATYAFERILDKDGAWRVYGKLRNALFVNETARVLLDFAICSGRLFPDQVPADATDSVSVRIDGFRFDIDSREFRSHVEVTNTSPSTLDPPLSLAFEIPDGIEFVRPIFSGRLCRDPIPLTMYYDLDVGSGLAPGESVGLDFSVKNRYNRKFTLVTRVFSGPGVR